MSSPSISKRFGIALKRRRLDLGYSQERLAELSKLHPTYIGMIERGSRNPTLEAAEKIAGALGVSLTNLISEAAREIPAKKGRKSGS